MDGQKRMNEYIVDECVNIFIDELMDGWMNG
jgi:hypothetical protein